jgi:uncharacterized protein YacL (UPF0231 family)
MKQKIYIVHHWTSMNSNARVSSLMQHKTLAHRWQQNLNNKPNNLNKISKTIKNPKRSLQMAQSSNQENSSFHDLHHIYLITK